MKYIMNKTKIISLCIPLYNIITSPNVRASSEDLQYKCATPYENPARASTCQAKNMESSPEPGGYALKDLVMAPQPLLITLLCVAAGAILVWPMVQKMKKISAARRRLLCLYKNKIEVYQAQKWQIDYELHEIKNSINQNSMFKKINYLNDAEAVIQDTMATVEIAQIPSGPDFLYYDQETQKQALRYTQEAQKQDWSTMKEVPHILQSFLLKEITEKDSSAEKEYSEFLCSHKNFTSHIKKIQGMEPIKEMPSELESDSARKKVKRQHKGGKGRTHETYLHDLAVSYALEEKA